MKIPNAVVESAIQAFTSCAQTPAIPSSGSVFRECLTAAIEAAEPYIQADVLRKAATDLRESAQIIAVRSHDAGIDNEGALHAMETDAGWLELQANNYEKGLIE